MGIFRKLTGKNNYILILKINIKSHSKEKLFQFSLRFFSSIFLSIIMEILVKNLYVINSGQIYFKIYYHIKLIFFVSKTCDFNKIQIIERANKILLKIKYIKNLHLFFILKYRKFYL